MNAQKLILNSLRARTLDKALNIRNLTTQNVNTVKKLYLIESRCLLPMPLVYDQTVRNSQSYLPKRKRGYVWQGRKEETDYDRSGLLIAYHWNLVLVTITLIYYFKKGMLRF